jgi:hypothetical protein
LTAAAPAYTDWGILNPDPLEQDRRIHARISPAELFALLLAVCLLAIFVWTRLQGLGSPIDYTNFVGFAQGKPVDYYYGYWMLPIFRLLGALPGPGGYILWNLLNLAGVFFATRVFGGKVILAICSYQMFYILYYGQISGLVVFGLALLWWGIAHRRWNWAGLGWIVAAAKFQVGLPIGLFLWLLADLTWRERLRILVVPALVSAASLILYPLWPLQLIQKMKARPPLDLGSLAPWRWIGAWALLFWVPPFVLPLSKEKRLIALSAATALGLPYFQQTELICLWVLPVGWLALLGNLGFFFPLLGWSALQYLAVAPLAVYLAALVSGARKVIRSGWSWQW